MIDQDVPEVVDPRFAADRVDVGDGVSVSQRLAAAAAEQSRVRDHVAAARASRAHRRRQQPEVDRGSSQVRNPGSGRFCHPSRSPALRGLDLLHTIAA